MKRCFQYNKAYFLLTCLTLLFCMVSCELDPPIINEEDATFIKYYGSSRNQRGVKVARLENGNLLLLGGLNSNTTDAALDPQNIRIVFTDAIGNEINTVNLPESDETPIDLTSLGDNSGFAILAIKSPASTSAIKIYKINQEGEITNTLEFGDNQFQYFPKNILATSDNGLLVSGSVDKKDNTGRNYYLLKLNADLSIAWELEQGVEGNEEVVKAFEEPQRIVLVLDEGQGINRGIKLGRIEKGTIPTTIQDITNNTTAQTPQSNFLTLGDLKAIDALFFNNQLSILASKGSASTSEIHLAQVLYAPNSEIPFAMKNSQSTKLTNSPGESRANSIARDSNGFYYISGTTRVNSIGGFDYLFIKLNDNGNLVFERQYGFSGDDQSNHILITPSNKVLLFGFMTFPQNQVMSLVKVDNQGNFHTDK